jgi:WD40 repeat-containing protein SMU1
MNYEIDSKDVIRLMLQFMKENNLQESATILSQESDIALNTVDNIDLFRSDIIHGKWEKVLPIVSNLAIPKDKMVGSLWRNHARVLTKASDCAVTLGGII